jgi:hypothetical protein
MKVMRCIVVDLSQLTVEALQLEKKEKERR